MGEQIDMVILNGRVLTMDDAAPRAEALAMGGGLIRAVGTTEEIRALAGPATKVIDAGGKTVLPGPRGLAARKTDPQPAGS